MRIDVLLYDGFDEVDAIAPFEVFVNAGFDTALVAAHDGPRDVRAGHGALLRADARREHADLVLVPGGGWNDRARAGARVEAERGALPALLEELHRTGTTIAAVCTGAMLLSVAGLLSGRPATTHHTALDDLRAGGARVVDARVVDDGDIITCGGVTAGLDLALHVVERECGVDATDAVARQMEHEPRGPVAGRPARQAR